MPKSFLNMTGYPRGLRNNNPGNIQATDPWKGMIGSDERGFAMFQDISWGLRALAIDLSTKIRKGYNTVSTIIYRYAPPSENNTDNYINLVCQYTGYDQDQILSSNETTIARLIRAIMNVELGNSYSNLITNDDIKEGIDLVETGSISVTTAAIGFGASFLLFLGALYLLATSPRVK